MPIILVPGPPFQSGIWRTVTSPPLCRANNPVAHQPLGTFEMPMGFRDMAALEDLNHVQFNVFKSENQQLFPLLLSKQFDYIFTLVLLLLQEDNVYHYVLIKSLRNVVNHVELRRSRTDKVKVVKFSKLWTNERQTIAKTKKQIKKDTVDEMQRSDICPQSFGNREILILNRHIKNLHGFESEREIFCSSCEHTSKSLLEKLTHLSSNHDRNTARVCVCCEKVFVSENDFKYLLQNHLSLPVSDESTDQLPVTSTFKNTFKSFHIDVHDSHDFLECVRKEESRIRLHLLEYAQKRPLKVNIGLEIPAEDTLEKTEVHCNTDMTPVFAEGYRNRTT